MSGLNSRRIVVGGLLAGVVMFLAHAAADTFQHEHLSRMFARLSLPEPDASAMPAFVFMALVAGSVGVFLYAALLPRFGAGARTGLLAGVVVWTLYTLLPHVGMLTCGILELPLFMIAVLSDLIIVPLAVLAGTAVYREPGTAAVRLGREAVRA